MSGLTGKYIRSGWSMRYLVFACCFLFFLFSAGPLRAQPAGPDSLMVFEFAVGEVELEKAGSYFNVLRIKNQDDKPIEGVVRIDVPDGWRIIGPSMDSVALRPGEEMLFPVRISMPGQTLGGVSFVIGAEFFGEDIYNYANAYISINRVSRWNIRLNTSQVYLSDFMPHGDFKLTLDNTGNSDEMIKLSFHMGGLIEFHNEMEVDSFMFVDVGAREDTSILFSLRSRKELTYSQKRSMSNNWRAKTLAIEASNPNQSLYTSVRTTRLQSSEINRLPIMNSPLNGEAIFYNLLSDRKKKATVRVFGKVLFPEDQQLTYTLGYNNLYFDPAMNREIDLYNQFRYSIRYQDPRSEVWLFHKMGLGTLHTLSGRGLMASHEFNESNGFRLHVIQNPFAGNIGGFAGYHGTLGDLSYETGLTAERMTDRPDGKYSLHLGGNYRLFQKHTIDIQTATTLSQFSSGPYLNQDTTVLGFAWHAFYRYSGNRLRINLDNMNTMFTHLRNSGINRIALSGEYNIKDDLMLRARYYRSDYSSTQYPYNFYFPENFSLNDNGRILLSRAMGKFTVQGGPQYTGVVRNQHISYTGTINRYANYQPGLIGSVVYRLAPMRSISPNAGFSMMYYKYGDYIEGEDWTGFENSWAYNLGINYYDHSFKLNVYYRSGEASDLYRSSVINNEPLINQSINVRPYYERYFFKEAVRLSAFVSYSYFTPSQREITLANLTGNFRLARTWNIFTSINLYNVKRQDSEQGRITSRDLNMLVGIRKAFDIQQPRLAYHDLTIVGFNDRDGDGLKNDDEKPISNVLVQISRDPKKNLENKTGFTEIGLITDPRGEIYYENIPEGVYDLTIVPLSALEDLYFLNGAQQSIEVRADQVHYLPLVESYKIRGRVIIDRDPNSNEGIVSAEGIRITAVSANGDTYTTLTNEFGGFILDLPMATSYEVSIYNVFGERFVLERPLYRVQFGENKSISLDFKFRERRRGIDFNDSEQYFQFNLDQQE